MPRLYNNASKQLENWSQFNPEEELVGVSLPPSRGGFAHFVLPDGEYLMIVFLTTRICKKFFIIFLSNLHGGELEGEFKDEKEKVKVMILFTFVLVMSTLQSCGNRKQSFSNSDDIVMGSIIVGSLDWKEITTLSSNSPIFENASFVGDVDLPAVGSRCTGFLISEDVQTNIALEVLLIR